MVETNGMVGTRADRKIETFEMVGTMVGWSGIEMVEGGCKSVNGPRKACVLVKKKRGG